MPAGDEQTTTAKLGSTLGAFLAVPTLFILAIAAVYAVGDAILAETPSPRNPGLADGILASRAVIAAIRVAIIAVAGYVVVSVVALVSRRQWLARIGPVEVFEQVSDIDTENAMLKDRLDLEQANAERLRAKLAEADAMMSSTVRRRREQRGS